MERVILLVEDNEDDVFLMQAALKKAGVANPVFVASDGQIALDYLTGAAKFADRSQFPMPALVLLDLKLPKLMGLDLLKAIRQNLELPPLLVVVLTSSDQAPDIERAYRLGANSYVVKPADLDRLVAFAQSLGEYWFMWNASPRRAE